MRTLTADVNTVKTRSTLTFVTVTVPYHHGDLLEALSTEAFEQVRAKGSDAVSLRAVAQAVGVSASAAYHHFPDKTALMQEVGHRGSLELDRRTLLAADAVRGRGRRAATERLRACGAAYIGFAQDEPHLFRHTFGPDCADSALPGEKAKDSVSYRTLGRCLDDLDRLGLLGPPRAGLDLMIWSAVHGFASLLIEGIVPAGATAPLMATMVSVLVRPPKR